MEAVETDERMRTLAALFEGLIPASKLGVAGAERVAGITDDSRQVRPGYVFVVIRGTAVDGRSFVANAVERGARVIVGNGIEAAAGAHVVDVDDDRRALAHLAQRWHGVNAEQIGAFKLLGITGTNGKTTTAIMTRAVLEAAGIRCGLLGTVQHDLCGRSVRAEMTTPGPIELAAYLRECINNGAQAAVMEVSSHALDQRRVAGLRFAAAAFTNLSGDHLDYHGTIEQYREAKARLFADLNADAVAVVNADDPNHTHMVTDCPARVMTYGVNDDADVTARITRSDSSGTQYKLRVDDAEMTVENAIVGRHNVYNALAAATLAHAVGVAPDKIAEGLAAVCSVPGRLQRVPCASLAGVFVDYAHTDDALRQVLSVLRPLAAKRLVVVFGCGGDRDRSKRPRMASVAAEFADAIIVTSDNPRTEDPHAIIADTLAGFDEADRRCVVVEVDRAAAIRVALTAADAGDIVLIAGKGHEEYQILGDRRVHFSDAQVAIETAAELYAERGEN